MKRERARKSRRDKRRNERLWHFLLKCGLRRFKLRGVVVVVVCVCMCV